MNSFNITNKNPIDFNPFFTQNCQYSPPDNEETLSIWSHPSIQEINAMCSLLLALEENALAPPQMNPNVDTKWSCEDLLTLVEMKVQQNKSFEEISKHLKNYTPEECSAKLNQVSSLDKKTWTKTQDQLLLYLKNQKMKFEEISKILNHSSKQCIRHLQVLKKRKHY